MDVLYITNKDNKALSIIALGGDIDDSIETQITNALDEFGISHIKGTEVYKKLMDSLAGQAEIDDYIFQLSYIEPGDRILFKYNPNSDEV